REQVLLGHIQLFVGPGGTRELKVQSGSSRPLLQCLVESIHCLLEFAGRAGPIARQFLLPGGRIDRCAPNQETSRCRQCRIYRRGGPGRQNLRLGYTLHSRPALPAGPPRDDPDASPPDNRDGTPASLHSIASLGKNSPETEKRFRNLTTSRVSLA